MVDTIFETSEYLKGRNIVRDNLYRICYLLSCHLRDKGVDMIEARSQIFSWGDEHRVWIKYDVNSIITRAYAANHKFYSSPMVKINKQDIERIKKSFDGRKVRYVALGLLCYAKAHANSRKEFYISSVALSAWLGINRKTLRNRYIKELIDFGYLTELGGQSDEVRWNKDFGKQGIKYRINCSLHNSGEHILTNNDVHKLFSEVFNASNIEIENL